VKKIFLVLVVLAVLVMLAPSNRERVMGWVSSVSPTGGQRSAERAMAEIAGVVASAAAENGTYPQAGAMNLWLEGRGESGEDPWGTAYHLELHPDSFVVRSAGPDARLRTDDDLLLSRPRAMPQPGVVITDFEPAPPPASAGRTAKSKALEAAQRQ
jgi:hypothetical protein